MQASLSLRSLGPLVLPETRSAPLHSHCQLALSFSPLRCKGLRRRILSRTPVCPAMRAHLTPPEDKGDVATNGTTKSGAVAAAVLACTLVAMCTSWKAKAYALDWFGSSRPATTSEDAPLATSAQIGTVKAKSIQTLREIFAQKCDAGTQKPAPVPKILLQVIKEEIHQDDYIKLKKYFDQLAITDKTEAATISLFEEWRQRPHDTQAYNLGLVLIDLLINQGDYKRADYVCQDIESYATIFDVRPKIRRAVLDLMSIADAIGSEVKESEKARSLTRRMEMTTHTIIQLIEGSHGAAYV